MANYQSNFTGLQIDDVITICYQQATSSDKTNLELIESLGTQVS
jgi:hypothetical protein